MKVTHLFALTATAACILLIYTTRFAWSDYRPAVGTREREYDAYDPLTDCVTPFGTVIGYVGPVPVLSNCNRRFKSDITNFVNHFNPYDMEQPYNPGEPVQRSMTSTAYDCLDFVSRYMVYYRGLIVSMHHIFYEQWEYGSFINPARPEVRRETEKYANYKVASTLDERKRFAPRVGDVIVYNADPAMDLSAGHLAVVVRVEADMDDPVAKDKERLRQLREQRLHPRKVYIAEQNFGNADWGGKNYTRICRFVWEPVRGATGLYESILKDPDSLSIIGRLRIGRELSLTEEEPSAEEKGLQAMDEDKMKHKQGLK
ncbi:hypothetical protein STCU_00689 [Strigomonas culicis]|uniref:Uncharacterized protein n=1 Tax=Strigomonas culicis TaxID=28005 RepID=S9UZF8_9TRYP|nr:hypothetical protein STCU_05692 [Strigomonas culicis]EPY35674.1 hypothetical protein STCU_01000 [Strigomonas culicis]EPY36232.1 hypothetical protein STCU_00689 [Strigomonas culicis]|eukprot:EPY27555.1 hypothetical protein STCU_05692 [Strigomonas culicis]